MENFRRDSAEISLAVVLQTAGQAGPLIGDSCARPMLDFSSRHHAPRFTDAVSSPDSHHMGECPIRFLSDFDVRHLWDLHKISRQRLPGSQRNRSFHPQHRHLPSRRSLRRQ